jgi:hypothetical protein
MLVMEKRKPGRPKGRKPTYSLNARIKPAIGRALEQHVETIQPETTVRAVVELALMEYLAKRKAWPPSDGDPDA